MCTLTWWSDAEGRYVVFFNRDEKKDRETAEPPVKKVFGGLRYLAPTDPRSRGSWLMVNEAGVTIALLNWYEREAPDEPAGGWKSRGHLVLDLADVSSPEMLQDRISGIEMSRYPPFRLMTFIPDRYGRTKIDGWEWTESGALAPMVKIEIPICSSSYETEAVIQGRRKRLEAFRIEPGVIDPGSLWRYHHGVWAEKGIEPPSPWTVRMNRPDAQTWSISQIVVNPESVKFLYEAESPDLRMPSEAVEVSLDRKLPS